MAVKHVQVPEWYILKFSARPRRSLRLCGEFPTAIHRGDAEVTETYAEKK